MSSSLPNNIAQVPDKGLPIVVVDSDVKSVTKQMDQLSMAVAAPQTGPAIDEKKKKHQRFYNQHQPQSHLDVIRLSKLPNSNASNAMVITLARWIGHTLYTDKFTEQIDREAWRRGVVFDPDQFGDNYYNIINLALSFPEVSRSLSKPLNDATDQHVFEGYWGCPYMDSVVLRYSTGYIMTVWVYNNVRHLISKWWTPFCSRLQIRKSINLLRQFRPHVHITCMETQSMYHGCKLHEICDHIVDFGALVGTPSNSPECGNTVDPNPVFVLPFKNTYH